MKLNTFQSLYLDFIRGMAAVAVLLHHYAKDIVNEGRRLPSAERVFPDVGQEAVIAFFVLSGYVIGFVSKNKEHSFGVFAAKRFARFYSVVVPSVIVLIICFYITTSLSPDVYAETRKGDMSHWPVKLVATLSFLNYNGLHPIYLPAGAPYWSLTCEWWYYALFGLAFYLRNRIVGILAIGMIAAVLGSPALLLFPIWLMGLAAFVINDRLRFPRWLLISVAGGTLALGWALWASGLRYSLLNTRVLIDSYFEHSTYFPYYWIVGFLLSLHLVAVMCLLSPVVMRDGSRIFSMFATGIRGVANGSFFLYLVHLPLLMMFDALWDGEPFPFFFPALALVICVVVGPPIENLRYPLFRVLDSWRQKFEGSRPLVVTKTAREPQVYSGSK